MTSNEMLFQMRRLRRYISEVREHQEDCRHSHQCHWLDKLSKAEGLAFDLEHEYELQEGEKLIAGIKAA